jgi:hypothetical protein
MLCCQISQDRGAASVIIHPTSLCNLYAITQPSAPRPLVGLAFLLPRRPCRVLPAASIGHLALRGGNRGASGRRGTLQEGGGHYSDVTAACRPSTHVTRPVCGAANWEAKLSAWNLRQRLSKQHIILVYLFLPWYYYYLFLAHVTFHI